MSAPTERPHIAVGDHVKAWYASDDSAIRVDQIRRATPDRWIVVGRRLSTNTIVAMPWTTSLVVVFHPLSDDEVFTNSEGLRRDFTTGCRECGAQWGAPSPSDGSRTLNHRDDCRYIKTLDQHTQGAMQ